MKPITHQEAQQLAASALGSFSYFLPSGEQFTSRCWMSQWFVVPAKDKLQIKTESGKVLQVP